MCNVPPTHIDLCRRIWLTSSGRPQNLLNVFLIYSYRIMAYWQRLKKKKKNNNNNFRYFVTCLHGAKEKKRKCALTEKISSGYAKHYLDVFRLMSNLQGTCVDVCQRSHIVPTTYSQRSGTCEPYGEYVVKFSACLKFHDVRDVLRRMTAYFIIFQRALNVYTTYP